MVVIRHRGDLKKTRNFLERIVRRNYRDVLEKYGQRGVDALSAARPKDTGKTAGSWEYEIEQTQTGYTIGFNNTNLNHGVSIALLLQYGHGTRNGGYVQGIDYINPALRPVFEKMADEAWQEVVKE